MKTFEQFSHQPITLPVTTGWYLSDPGEARGKQALFRSLTPAQPQGLSPLTFLIDKAESPGMNHKVTLLEEDDYDLNDDVAPEYDFAGIREQAKAEGREYRGTSLDA